MGSMFFEASTRTFCSFAAAMQRLGGSVIPLKASDSSAMKGETLSGKLCVTFLIQTTWLWACSPWKK